MRLSVVGLGLVAAVGVLVFVIEQPGPGPSAAAPAAAGSSATATASSAPVPASFAPAATVPAPASPAPKPRHGALPMTTVTSYLASRSGVVQAAVYDVDTRQTWTIGSARQRQAAASIVKVDILETLFAQRHGGLSAADQALAQRMIEDSDNDAATALWNAVGGTSGIRAYNAAIGLTGTAPSSCVQCPGFPWPGWGLSTTTAADQIALLRELAEPSSFMSNAERDSAVRLMENVTPAQRWGVSGGVPAQATVALKNGWLPLNPAQTDWQVNSVGWVSGLGRNYLIAVLTTGNPTEAYGIATIEGLSAIVWKGTGGTG